MLATTRAERQWVEAIIADIQSGKLDWGEAALRQIAHLLESEQQKPG